eukprot:8696558-Karenia_brevis.AAC.1
MDRLSRSEAMVAFIQEHKCVTQEEIARASSQWLKAGWKFAYSPGILTAAGGASSGTAVVVRKHIPVDYISGAAAIPTFTIIEGRAAACIVKHA